MFSFQSTDTSGSVLFQGLRADSRELQPAQEGRGNDGRTLDSCLLGLEMKEGPWDLGRSLMILSQGCSKMTENILPAFMQAQAFDIEFHGRPVIRLSPPSLQYPLHWGDTQGDFLVSGITLAICSLLVTSVWGLEAPYLQLGKLAFQPFSDPLLEQPGHEEVFLFPCSSLG